MQVHKRCRGKKQNIQHRSRKKNYFQVSSKKLIFLLYLLCKKKMQQLDNASSVYNKWMQEKKLKNKKHFFCIQLIHSDI